MVGLFESWSRGTAETSSDVDLFILDREDFAYEYVGRVERSGFLIDLNRVPRRWIRGQIPHEIDQRLYENADTLLYRLGLDQHETLDGEVL